MAANAHDQRLDRIANTIGVTRADLLTALPGGLSTNVVVIDGAPGQFDRWADQVSDPGRRRRLATIAGILDAGKARRGEP